ncbi:conserved membrane protein of unknown function [Modestobacter italicus]|uniref:DUF805 domain-containing protein n=1 Tax=Modestobacter italicus (strain DSM 44449 / CECT 9708 / BC 501) TaxID=2732864 RepID=I4F3F6_MODI5|nr:DUF805 domain-containing protein [Modestobacter marinus]CCH90169.1 conserved membrane protein of unknown function [Modestobacter marinus]
MSIGQWYVSRGRITRRTFWLTYVLPILGASIVAAVIDALIGSDYGAGYGIVGALVALATIVPSISSTVTRLHDRDHSAWWLLFGLIPLVGGILLLIQTGFLPGTEGPNSYGPPPAPVGGPLADPGYPQSYS